MLCPPTRGQSSCPTPDYQGLGVTAGTTKLVKPGRAQTRTCSQLQLCQASPLDKVTV
jgi:hypothetical protein